MAYSEQLADRVRGLLADRIDVEERPMFGGLTFMVRGHMCCGVHGEELVVRVHPDDERAALARRHARPMDFTTRRMRGFLTVAAAKRMPSEVFGSSATLSSRSCTSRKVAPS